MCCGCCCDVLIGIKRSDNPSAFIASPFRSALKENACDGCGACIDRCQMDVIQMGEEKVFLNTSRCIGCGHCVSACPNQAMTLERKTRKEQPKVSWNLITSIIDHGLKVNKFSISDLLAMQVKSKVDRIRDWRS